MTVQNTLTYDLVTPVRPALADLQNATKKNDPVYPPDDAEDPFAEEANQQAEQIAALSRTNYVMLVEVHFSAGNPTIVAHSECPTGVVIGDFTVADLGVGDTSITIPAGTLPPALVSAGSDVVQDVDVTIRTIPITNGWRIKTVARSGGSGTDANFVLRVA